MAIDATTTAQIRTTTEIRQKKLRLGEALIEQGLINQTQLDDALKRQAQVGGHLGSILIDLGYITLDTLIEALGKSLGFPGVNLFKRNISEKVLKSIPKDKITSLHVIPIAADEHNITLAMAEPQDMKTISELEFQLGKKIRPVVVPFFMIQSTIKAMDLMTDNVLKGADIIKISEEDREKITKAPKLLTLLKYLIKSKASDMLLTVGVPPSIRISSEVYDQLEDEDVREEFSKRGSSYVATNLTFPRLDEKVSIPHMGTYTNP